MPTTTVAQPRNNANAPRFTETRPPMQVHTQTVGVEQDCQQQQPGRPAAMMNLPFPAAQYPGDDTLTRHQQQHLATREQAWAHQYNDFSWRDPLQATRVWGQFNQAAAPMAHRPVAPATAPRDAGRQNLTPPPVNQPATLPSFTTTFPVLEVQTPNGQRTIQGWSQTNFNPSPYYNCANNAMRDMNYDNVAWTGYHPQYQGWGGFQQHEPSLDLANFLPSSTIQSIHAWAYVDFTKILPDNNDDGLEECEETELPTQGSSRVQCVVRHKKVKAQSIDGIIKWIRAFSIWAFVYLDTHPGEGKGLFQHLHQILDGDRQYVWSKVYKCDKAVRQNVAKDNNLKIGVMDLRLWQNVSGHIKHAMQITMRPSASRSKVKSSGKRNKPPCRRYNDGHCSRDHCRFAHVCEICKSESHTKLTCKNKNVGNIDGVSH